MRPRDAGARLVSVRWVVHGWVALALVGCSRDNPWFALNTAGSVESDSSQSGSGSSGPGDPSDSSGGGSSGGSTSSTSTTGSTGSTGSSTDPIDSTSTTLADTSSTGDTGSTGSSTGEPGPKLILDLYEACPDALWTDELIVVHDCPGDPNLVPSVAQVETMFDNLPVQAVAAFPSQQVESFLDGGYAVDLTGAISPHFVSELWFPAFAAPTDKLTGSVFVVIDMNVVELFTEQISLAPGQSATIDLDLSGAPVDAKFIELHLQVLVESSAKQQVRGLWLGPKIIDLQ